MQRKAPRSQQGPRKGRGRFDQSSGFRLKGLAKEGEACLTAGQDLPKTAGAPRLVYFWWSLLITECITASEHGSES